MQQIAAFVKRQDWTQVEAASHCGVTQPRINDLLRSRVSRFSLDALLNISTARVAACASILKPREWNRPGRKITAVEWWHNSTATVEDGSQRVPTPKQVWLRHGACSLCSYDGAGDLRPSALRHRMVMPQLLRYPNRAETGLDYFGARYFSGAQGRFTSPDEFTGGIVDPFTGQQVGQPGPLPYADITDPQTLNKYVYVRNNPLRYIDPDGHDFWDYVKGTINAFTSDNTAGVGRIDGGNGDFQRGQAIGDAVATIQGAVETLAGAGGEIGGTVLDLTGVGALIGVPTQVVSAGAIVHGSATATVGFVHLAKAANAPGTTASGQATDAHGNKIGPSGKAQVNQVNHSTEKAAKDAARAEGKGAPVKHPSPTKGKPHYHPTDRKGEKIPCSTHHNCPS